MAFLRLGSIALVVLLLLPGLSGGASPPARHDEASLLALSDGLSARMQALAHGREGVPVVAREALGLGAFPLDAAPAFASPTLEIALLRLEAVLGVPVDGALQADVAAQVARLPPHVAADLLPLVDAVADAHVASRAILPEADARLLAEDPALAARLLTFVESAPGPVPAEWEAAWAPRAAALARVDKVALAAASLRLADAVGAFRGETTGATGCARLLALPFVEVGGTCDDVYEQDNALQVDYGGRDAYRNNAGAGITGGVGAGLSIDLGADDDAYVSAGNAQGFGLAGVGILVDEGGSDLYSATSFAQGSAAAGFGLLFDAGIGNDRYLSPREAGMPILTKAGGLAGVGILVDEGGDDVYHQDGLDGFVYGAGGGVGFMLERGGDDSYRSDDHPIVLLGSYLGEFAGPVQISAEAGGSAFLVEQGGDDTYRCGDHVRQGCQSAAGVGALSLLLDEGGDDVYTMGVSVSPELAAGILVFPMGQGIAYGFAAPPGLAAALLRDAWGNDTYVAQRAAQGYASGGFALLLDEGGRDGYSLAAALVGSRADGGAWADGTAGAGRDQA